MNIFKPEGIGTEGLTLIERDITEEVRTKTIKTRIYLFHNRKGTRDISKHLTEIKSELGSEAGEIASSLLGVSNPWLVAGAAAYELIGGILSKIKDRDFGMVSMDEKFGNEFDNVDELDRKWDFSSGDAELFWSWSLNK